MKSVNTSTSEKASTAEAASENTSAAVVEEMAAENEACDELDCTLAGVEVMCLAEVVSGDLCSGEPQERGASGS